MNYLQELQKKIENDFKIMFAPEDEKEVEKMTEQELNDTFAKLHPDSRVSNGGENNEFEGSEKDYDRQEADSHLHN